jgi:hypothetical protein
LTFKNLYIRIPIINNKEYKCLKTLISALNLWLPALSRAAVMFLAAFAEKKGKNNVKYKQPFSKHLKGCFFKSVLFIN